MGRWITLRMHTTATPTPELTAWLAACEAPLDAYCDRMRDNPRMHDALLDAVLFGEPPDVISRRYGLGHPEDVL